MRLSTPICNTGTWSLVYYLQIMPKRKAKSLTLKGEKKRIDSSRQKRRLNPEYLHNESERDKSTQQKRREDPKYLAHQLSRDNSTRRSRRELIKCIQIRRSESSIQSNQHISNSVETSAITEESQNKIDIKFANFFFRTGISLRIVESEVFKELVKELNPSYKPPCTKKLSGAFLDKQFSKCSTVLDEILV
ncbi:hypothetical protein PVAND_014448 [Polypedilum vanderplanki]|uniref:Uncharacterized protein n=1 Tax=Polypedilum vanderplanki TaxID=319348 RepID=A0A9J6BA80_POLVA|nr:hypothetical protein PVAND_014448 [Polypedilum vanderplanki]